MGGADEHLQSPGRGDPDGGAYQQLTLNLFLSEAEQIQSIDEAENVAHTSSAFSFAQNDIDHVLRLGGNTDRQRERVVAAFEKQKTTAEITEILKTLYHGGNGLGSVSAWYARMVSIFPMGSLSVMTGLPRSFPWRAPQAYQGAF